MASKAKASLRKSDDDWTDEDEAKKADSAAASDDDDKKQDDDKKEELDKADEDDDQDDDDDDSTGAGIGEFRVRVMPNGFVRMVLADEEDEDEDEDDSDGVPDGTPGPDAGAKSLDPAGRQRVTAASLEKALQAVQQYASAADPAARRTALLRRAQSKQGLAKSEARELFFSLAGQGQNAPGGQLRQRVDSAFDADGSLTKSARAAADTADAVEYLDSFASSMSKGLGLVADEVEAASARDHQANLLLFKAVAKIGQAVKAVAERVDAVASGPARAPKSLGHGAPVRKAFGGTATGAANLSREEAADLIAAMSKAAARQGNRGFSKGGHDLNTSLDVLMTTGRIDPELLRELQEFQQTTRTAS